MLKLVANFGGGSVPPVKAPKEAVAKARGTARKAGAFVCLRYDLSHEHAILLSGAKMLSQIHPSSPKSTISWTTVL